MDFDTPKVSFMIQMHNFYAKWRKNYNPFSFVNDTVDADKTHPELRQSVADEYAGDQFVLWKAFRETFGAVS